MFKTLPFLDSPLILSGIIDIREPAHHEPAKKYESSPFPFSVSFIHVSPLEKEPV